MTLAAGGNAVASDLIYPTSVTAVDSSVTDGSTSSTSATNSLTTTLIRGVAFTAGTSGRVLVWSQAAGRSNTAGSFTFLDFEIRTGSTVGSGTVVRASNANTMSTFQSDSANQQGPLLSHGLVTGLTPGTTYNACLTYWVNANTGTYNRRSISVLYVP